MAPPCSTCTHSQRAAIDQALVAGQPSQRELADQYGVDRASLARHRKHHLSAALRAVVTRRETAGPRKALDRLEDLYLDADEVKGQAKEKGNTRDALGAITAQRGIVETLAKITGELDERPTVQVLTVATSPEWQETRARIMAALRPYPEAAQAVAAALASPPQGDRPELVR